MKKCVLFVLGTYAFILGVSAYLSPLLYGLVQGLWEQFPCDFFSYLAQKPFGQYFDRCRTFVIIISLPFLLRFMRIKWTDLRLKFNVLDLKIGFMYFFFGTFLWTILLILICSQIGCLEPKLTNHGLFYISSVSVLAGITLACVEEIVFRGLLLRFFLKNMSYSWSLHGLAFIFAFLHFSNVRNDLPEAVPWILKGFYCAYFSFVDMFTSIQWTYFFNLYSLSLLLTLSVLKTKTLWSAIGFHAGLISTLMCIRHCYHFPEIQSVLWGSGRLTDAWVSVGILLLVCILLARKRPASPRHYS